ncbi:restriction endonuclease subunit S [Polaribacter sp. OB-PA-B3]
MVNVENKIQRYDSYKDSGVEWLGEIPEHWEITRLANIGRFSSSGIDKLIKKNESLVRIVNYTDVYKNLEHTINSKMNFMEVTTPETNRVKNLVNKGDLIFLPSSETLEDLGLSALVDEEIENLSFSYHVLRFEFTKEVSHRFKKYFSNNQAVLNEFSKKGTGSIRKTLGRNDFRNTIVILPPLQEQIKIAQFLDDKTSKIDAAIDIKEQQINLLKERKQILIHKAVTRGLDDSVALKDSGVEWIGEIPAHWEEICLKHLVLTIGDIDHYMPETVEQGYPYVMTGDLKELASEIDFANCKKVSQTDYKKLSKKIRSTKGDIILARYATIGTLTYVDINENFLVSYSCVTIKPNQTKLLGLFLCNYLKSDVFETEAKFQTNTNTQGNVGIGDLKNIKLFLPPLSEQKEISAYIETASQKIETAISLKQQEIAKLKEYKSSLINSVVTGKVRVC